MSKIMLMAAVAVAIALPAAAQKADLSGTWNLNVQKSFLAGDHPDKAYSLTKVIVQKGNAIEQTDIAVHVTMMNIPRPDSKVKVELVPDGKEYEVTIPSPFPGLPARRSTMTAEWQGTTLVVVESSPSTTARATTTRRYYLSDDGTQLIELVEGHNGFGDTEQRLVFDKQR